LFSKKSKENTTIDLSISQRTVRDSIYRISGTVIQIFTVGPKQRFRIRHDRILSIRRISDFGKKSDSVGFGIRHIPSY